MSSFFVLFKKNSVSLYTNCKMKYSLNEGNLVERMIPRKSIKNVIKNHIPELLKYRIIKKL